MYARRHSGITDGACLDQRRCPRVFQGEGASPFRADRRTETRAVCGPTFTGESSHRETPCQNDRRRVSLRNWKEDARGCVGCEIVKGFCGGALVRLLERDSDCDGRRRLKQVYAFEPSIDQAQRPACSCCPSRFGHLHAGLAASKADFLRSLTPRSRTCPQHLSILGKAPQSDPVRC